MNKLTSDRPGRRIRRPAGRTPRVPRLPGVPKPGLRESYGLRVTGYGLRVTGYGLRVTGCPRLPGGTPGHHLRVHFQGVLEILQNQGVRVSWKCSESRCGSPGVLDRQKDRKTGSPGVLYGLRVTGSPDTGYGRSRTREFSDVWTRGLLGILRVTGYRDMEVLCTGVLEGVLRRAFASWTCIVWGFVGVGGGVV